MKIGIIDNEKFRILFNLLALPMGGIYASIKLDDWDWFARSGSLMVTMSILSFGLAYVQREKASLAQMMSKTNEDHIKALSLIEESIAKYYWAVLTAAIGTLFWGLGDLIGQIDFGTLTTG